MAQIKAGTTGQADSFLYDPCVLCHAPNTQGFDTGSTPAPGWGASFENETVTVPPEAAPGSYTMTVRTSFTQYCGGGGDDGLPTAPCKHLDFEVIAADSPDVPGPGVPPC